VMNIKENGIIVSIFGHIPEGGPHMQMK